MNKVRRGILNRASQGELIDAIDALDTLTGERCTVRTTA
jgi:hypothetical protein